MAQRVGRRAPAFWSALARFGALWRAAVGALWRAERALARSSAPLRTLARSGALRCASARLGAPVHASARPGAPRKGAARFCPPACLRYKMLVLYGPSRTGKTRLARSLFGDDRTLVVDVQHAEHPDLRAYRRHTHKAVLLDEVQGPSFIVNNKKLLQAHVDGAILGQSATQLYTYEVFLWRTPIMISTNNWCLDDLTDEEREWVHANCVVVHITEEVFEAKRQRVL